MVTSKQTQEFSHLEHPGGHMAACMCLCFFHKAACCMLAQAFGLQVRDHFAGTVTVCPLQCMRHVEHSPYAGRYRHSTLLVGPA